MGPECNEQQRKQCSVEAPMERGFLEGNMCTLHLMEQDGAEQRPLQRAEKVSKQLVEAIEHE